MNYKQNAAKKLTSGRQNNTMLESEREPARDLPELGVAVAVKKPVSTSVVVTIDTEPPEITAVGVCVELGDDQSEEASYSTPFMITPCCSMIMFFSSSVQVLGMLRSQQVEEGDGGSLLV